MVNTEVEFRGMRDSLVESFKKQPREGYSIQSPVARASKERWQFSFPLGQALQDRYSILFLV